jgi:ABC-type polysaccharide/polyol phosphate export permease
MIKQFINDIKKYSKYIAYSTKAQLKSEVANSYLSWIWLILEPICFMLIYTFLAVVVFKSKVEYFPIFVFIGII